MFFVKIKKLKLKNNKGFTLIELLAVIAIIGILSSVVLASLNATREKARDSRRKSDLEQIRIAMSFYFDKHNNWMQTGSGCGYGGNGNGWFNYVGGSYPKAMSKCLLDEEFSVAEIIDPTGGKTSNPTTGFSYMKYSCGTPIKTYIYAKLEGVPQGSTATNGTCCASCDSNYGMNYYVIVN